MKQELHDQNTGHIVGPLFEWMLSPFVLVSQSTNPSHFSKTHKVGRQPSVINRRPARLGNPISRKTHRVGSGGPMNNAAAPAPEPQLLENNRRRYTADERTFRAIIRNIQRRDKNRALRGSGSKSAAGAAGGGRRRCAVKAPTECPRELTLTGYRHRRDACIIRGLFVNGRRRRSGRELGRRRGRRRRRRPARFGAAAGRS